MFDYQLHGLNAGGYHVTNLILHVLSTLLLFWLFNRMTGAVWRSAFVAALFALHPLHVESVAWISERKDVLSAFFWMLTLCLYVYYTEKPVIRRYLLVLFSFALALMSKPMVVTLPVVMILLDYWPLDRLQSRKVMINVPQVTPIATNKGKKKNKSKSDTVNKTVNKNISPSPVRKLPEPKIGGIFPLWQLQEKIPFFILSAILVIVSLYNPNASAGQLIPFGARIANSLVTFVIYLEKTFWPHNMAVYYPFPSHIPIWQVIGASLLIILITISVIITAKRWPYLFAGWFWFAITIAPVIGIIQISVSAPYAMADRYHYLPSIGIAVGLAWGIPCLFKREDIQKKILLPAGIAALFIMAVLSWQQCGYWKNSIELWSHVIRVTKDNALAHVNRGTAYDDLGNYQFAIEDYNEALRLKPDDADVYYNRGNTYASGLGRHERAIEDYNEAIRIKPYAQTYNNRGYSYDKLGQYQRAIGDYNQAIHLKPDNVKFFFNRGLAYAKLGQNQSAIQDFNEAIRLKPDSADAYDRRGTVHLMQGQNELGCPDAQKACELGDCKLLEMAKGKGVCR
jgi:tetratricopeptide (TPR) repeat protein